MYSKATRFALILTVGLSLTAAAQAQQPGEISVGRGEITYFAKEGDTLTTIAQKYTNKPANWSILSKRNRIANDRAIPIGTGIAIPFELLPETSIEAKVAAFSGDSTLDTGTGSATPVTIGLTVREGMIITTGKNGFVTLALPDNSRVSVPSNSAVKLTKLRTTQYANSPRTELTLLEGRVESSVSSLEKNKGRFEVHSPLAIAGVRGTHFRVGIAEQGIANEVLEGNVAVGQTQKPNTLMLSAGKGNIVSRGSVGRAVDLLPPPALTDNYAVQERIIVQFNAEKMPQATSYRAQIANDAQTQNLIQEGVFTEPRFKFSGIPDGQYFVRVSAIDSNGLEGIPKTLAFKLKAQPEPPFNIQPKRKIRSDRVDFSWSEAARATAYHLQIASDADFNRIVQDQVSLDSNQYSTNKLPLGHYFWRVATISKKDGQADHGPFGDVENFELLPAPKDIAPLQDTGANEMALSWAAEPGQKFIVQIGRDAAFTSLLLNQELSVAEIHIPRPDPGTYYVRVKAIDPDGYVGPFTGTQKITIFSRWMTNSNLPLSTSGGVARAGF